MPAEKLTFKRLIQLVIMFTILSGAFFYRTYVHNQKNEQESAVENSVISSESE